MPESSGIGRPLSNRSLSRQGEDRAVLPSFVVAGGPVLLGGGGGAAVHDVKHARIQRNWEASFKSFLIEAGGGQGRPPFVRSGGRPCPPGVGWGGASAVHDVKHARIQRNWETSFKSFLIEAGGGQGRPPFVRSGGRACPPGGGWGGSRA